MSAKKKNMLQSTILAALVIGFVFLIYYLEQDYMKDIQSLSPLPVSDVMPTPLHTDKEVDFYDKVRAKEFIRILIIGDSIGEGTGAQKAEDKWFTRLTASLDSQYDITNSITNLSIGGASVLGGWSDYNIQKPFLKEKYDLVFICFGQNDQGVLPINSYQNIYESLIKQLKEEKSNPELYLIIENAVGEEEYPDAVQKLAAQYDLNVIDTRLAFKQSGLASSELTIDGVHPNSKGHELYYQAIMETINSNLRENKRVSHQTAAPPIFVDAVQAKSFSFTTIYSAVSGFSSKLSNSIGTAKGNTLEATLTGATLGVVINQSPDGGKFDLYVDGVFIKELDNYSPAPRRNTYLIGDRFIDGVHKVRVEVNGNKSKDAKGTKVEVLGFVSSQIR